MVVEVIGVIGDIYKSVKTLLTTPVGTVVLDRKYGLDWEMVDMPLEAAESLALVEIEEKLEIYEPRVSLVEVDFKTSTEGTLIAKVVLDLANQESPIE